MKLFRNISPHIFIVLILLVGLLFANSIINKHYHVLSDGTVIVHSHPFAKNTENNQPANHHHSQKELLLLDLITNPILIFIVIAITIISVLNPLKQILTFYSLSYRKTNPINLTPGRAPPINLH
ncbi:MAG: hypothetical protein KAT68_10205 [Bacteroidales bacterium]|nr:hypothetical protein [Bacteroidales bacterium]